MAQVLRDAFAAGYATRYMASSAQCGSALIEARGYTGSAPVVTDGGERKIFENISNDDAIDFICHAGGARTVVLAPAAAAKEQRTRAQ